MSSSLPLKVIISHLRELAELEVPALSEAADTVALLYRAVKRVNSDQGEFEELSTKAAKLLYAVINSLRKKGQRDLDNNSKSNIDAFAGVVEKVLELALKNSTRSDFIAFWCSDKEEIEVLRSELDARLRAFGFKSFDDLQAEPKQSVPNQSVERSKGSNVAPEPTKSNDHTRVERHETGVLPGLRKNRTERKSDDHNGIMNATKPQTSSLEYRPETPLSRY